MKSAKEGLRMLGAALGIAVRGGGVCAAAQAQAPKLRAQVQPRAGPKGALSRGLPELGEGGRGADQGRTEDRGLPQRAARQRGGHHRADPPGRQHRPEHRLGAHRQLRSRHRRDERPLFRRDAGGGGQAAQVADRQQVAGGAGRASTASRSSASTGCRATGTSSPTSRSRTPRTSKGLRIRTPPAPIWQESIRALGAAPVAMAFGEMYPGLQQKAIDGVELVYNNIPGGRFYEVLKYANETKHIMLINFEVISAKWFDSAAAGVPERSWSRNATRRARRPRRQIFKLEAEVEAAAEGARHDDRRGRRSRGVPQGGREGLRGAEDRRRKNAVHKEIGKK